MSEDRWPSPPDCPVCHALKSTEMLRQNDRGQYWMLCNSCSKLYLVDKYGQILARADEVRG